ncbi:MAG: hypothetical protein AAF743_11815, partial [Planctomycetota bacterium]
MRILHYYLTGETGLEAKLTKREAEGWIAAALEESAALHERDREALPIDPTPVELTNAEQIHAAWARWIESVEKLAAQIRQSLPESVRLMLKGWHDLRMDLAIGQLLTERSPRAHADLMRGIRDGTIETVSIDELRENI